MTDVSILSRRIKSETMKRKRNFGLSDAERIINVFNRIIKHFITLQDLNQ